jgi:probable H4MPT-linked C1 transfer pathway protein
MNEKFEFILSLDIGGANTKYSLIFLDIQNYLENSNSSDAKSYKNLLKNCRILIYSTEYFPFWMKQKKEFPKILLKIKKEVETQIFSMFETKSTDISIIATITAELSDAFSTKEEGIKTICDDLAHVFDDSKIRIIDINSNFLTTDQARSNYLKVSASNWVATSLVLGENTSLGILLDMGSTTLDLIPIKDSYPVTTGKNDVDRLLNNELLYTGILRAPLPSIVQSVPLRNSKCPISFERFAIMADVYRILDKISEEQYSCDTADGRGKSKIECYARLSRMLCGDLNLIKMDELDEIANYIYKAQKKLVKESIRLAISQFVRRFVTPVSKIKFNVTGLGANLLLIPSLIELDIPEKQIFIKQFSEKEHVVSTAICLGLVFLKKRLEDMNLITSE